MPDARIKRRPKREEQAQNGDGRVVHDGSTAVVRPKKKVWSGRRDSNPRPQPWQGCALPLSYARSELTPKPCPAEVRRAPSMVTRAPARRLWQPLEPPIWAPFD